MVELDCSRYWPELPYSEWRETAITLQLWMQIVGKIRLALTPWLNHGWHVPFYVTARGRVSGLCHRRGGQLRYQSGRVHPALRGRTQGPIA
jgi:hypothetical protein